MDEKDTKRHDTISTFMPKKPAPFLEINVSESFDFYQNQSENQHNNHVRHSVSLETNCLALPTVLVRFQSSRVYERCVLIDISTTGIQNNQNIFTRSFQQESFIEMIKAFRH